MASKSAPYPTLLGWLAGCTEFFGGIALLLGLLSRLAALGLACVMYVAITTVHWTNGFSISDNGYEFCLVLLLAALAIVLGGPGGLSLDRILFSRRKKPKK